MFPFIPGRFSVRSVLLQDTYSKSFKSVYYELKELLESRRINFNKEPLVQSHPKINNDIIYESIALHLNYFVALLGDIQVMKTVMQSEKTNKKTDNPEYVSPRSKHRRGRKENNDGSAT